MINKEKKKKEKKKKKKLEGLILKNLPNTTFLVKITNKKKKGKKIICYMSGKMRMNFIRLIQGDKVKIELNKHDYSKGRIIYRIR
ncbi:translation initiation factor IF-1 [Candidatus Vidania fulgoroideorum]